MMPFNGENQLQLRDSESRGNLNHIRKINALIPMAEKEARRNMSKNRLKKNIKCRSGHKDGGMMFFDNWTKLFHEAMAKLTRERGLRK